MDHAVLVGSQLHEGTEFHDPDYLTGKDHACLYLGNDVFNNGNRFVDHLLIRAAYIYSSVVGDIDLYAGLSDDAIDHLALLSYHIANLLGIDHDLGDLGRILGKLLSGLGDHRSHYIVHDVKAGLTAAADGLFDDLAGQAVDLDIHLDGCDSLMGTAHLKVHVSKEVLKALDICKHQVVVVGLSGHKTAGDTGYHGSDRYACCH